MTITKPTYTESLLKQILDEIKKFGSVQPPVTPPQTSTGFYVPKTSLSLWLESHKSDQNYNLLNTKIATKPTYIWLNGGESSANQNAEVVKRVQDILKDAKGQTVGFSLYAIPGRDAGQDSAGGLKDANAYNAYVGAIGYAIQQAGNPRVDVVVETDALGLNLPLAYTCINAAVDILKKNSNTKVFLTASEWVGAQDMAGRLKGAGVERADGVAVNVAGRTKLEKVEPYVKQVLTYLKPGLLYLIDTSRNGGNTAEADWNNPMGEKLGLEPKLFNEGQKYAYVWVKIPGESDGHGNGGPDAGKLWIERAIYLAQ